MLDVHNMQWQVAHFTSGYKVWLAELTNDFSPITEERLE